MPKNQKSPLKDHILNFKSGFHGGLIKENAEKYGLREEDILDFSANLNPFKAPFDHPEYGLDFGKLAQEAYADSCNYPDNRYTEFKKAAALFLNMPELNGNNIIPGNGSTEIIRLFCQCVLNAGDKVIIPYPTFGEYEIQCRIQDAEIVSMPQEKIDTITEEELGLIGAKILFVCNPNNPTAVLRQRKDLEILAEKCRKTGTVLFVDEAFIELSDPNQSVCDLAAAGQYVFVMRSLTKCFEIPGIRLGFGVAHPNIAEALNNARLAWNLSPLQEKIAVSLLSMEGGVNSDYLKKSRELILGEAAFLKQELSEVWGFEPGVVSTNFLLIDISKRTAKATELTERFAKYGILIRNCVSFKGLGEDYIRIAVRVRSENERLIQTVSKVFGDWAKEFADSELKNVLDTHKSGSRNKRKTCEYYPCHFEGQDCTFCYCPFYPCNDERGGGQYVKSLRGCGDVWSCVDCYIPHIPSVADKMMAGLLEDGDTDKILKREREEIIQPIFEEKDDEKILSLCRKIREENKK